MKLFKKTPTTPGTRHQINLKKSLLSKSTFLIKNLKIKHQRSNGRSSKTGHITVWHRSGGCKKLYRGINFTNNTTKSIVININYDPFRTAFIALCFNFLTKTFFFTLAAQSIFPGSIIICQNNLFNFFFGNRTQIKNLPTGTLLYNLSINKNSKAIISRAAGTFSQLIQNNDFEATIRIPSGKIIKLNSNAYASLGRVSNIKHNLTFDGKAGRNVLRGLRPIVRGVAMNPVDHPHGGRTKGGRPSVTPWGIITKGKPTVKKRKYE